MRFLYYYSQQCNADYVLFVPFSLKLLITFVLTFSWITVKRVTGVYIFHFYSTRGGGKNITYWLAGEIYDLLRKRKYKGKEVEKRGEKGKFHCTRRKKILF